MLLIATTQGEHFTQPQLWAIHDGNEGKGKKKQPRVLPRAFWKKEWKEKKQVTIYHVGFVSLLTGILQRQKEVLEGQNNMLDVVCDF